jgi:hypothetical protein
MAVAEDRAAFIFAKKARTVLSSTVVEELRRFVNCSSIAS